MLSRRVVREPDESAYRDRVHGALGLERGFVHTTRYPAREFILARGTKIRSQNSRTCFTLGCLYNAKYHSNPDKRKGTPCALPDLPLASHPPIRPCISCPMLHPDETEIQARREWGRDYVVELGFGVENGRGHCSLGERASVGKVESGWQAVGSQLAPQS